MTVTIELPDKLESLLLKQAKASGISADGYIRNLVERDLESVQKPLPPFKTGRGMLAKYGDAPSLEEIDQNRAEMFGRFAEDA